MDGRDDEHAAGAGSMIEEKQREVLLLNSVSMALV
jgi:hypothetical protein